MPDTDLVVLVARMDERYKVIEKGLEETKQSFKDQLELIAKLSQTVEKMNARLEDAEAQLLEAGPTIQDFINIKQKVLGAGILGKWLWLGSGVVITWLFHARTEIVSWLSLRGS